jgi:ribulose 1,5-bisphosphate carboxylase large subunit-like protein
LQIETITIVRQIYQAKTRKKNKKIKEQIVNKLQKICTFDAIHLECIAKEKELQKYNFF